MRLQRTLIYPYSQEKIHLCCQGFDHDIFLRIGGDEFVVFTSSEDKAHAENIAVETHIGSFLGFPEKISAEVVFYEIAKKMNIIHYLDNKTSEE